MKRIKKVLAIAAIVMLMAGVAGCARLQSGIHDLHGSIVGNEYNIDIFDNTGIRTLRSHGKKIDIDNNIVEERTYASATDEWYSTKTLSSVITITIDGRQLISCGDTCVFYDKRLTPEYEFYLDKIESDSSGILDSTLISGRVNSIKNEFGKPMVVVIKSYGGGHQIADGSADLCFFRGQSVLGYPGRPAEVYKTDDRWESALYSQSKLPDR